jgi:sialic acid synthase SpsE
MIKLIAEIGINHQGNANHARLLLRSAHNSGVSHVKFQYRNIVSGLPMGKEIGDEILNSELQKNHLGVDVICDLVKFSKELGLESGISFFSLEDTQDWDDLSIFDFFKIPSAVMHDRDLIFRLLSTGKEVYISTGTQSESTIESILSSIESFSNWTPLHCISNYPTATHNANLGYLLHLKKRWNRKVGFSSHDANWSICALALSLGAEVIERHITLDKSSPGLDHSSSSTPDEFFLLSDLCKNYETITRPIDYRKPNQGERINQQNLGRSYYARRPYIAGERIKLNDLDYRPPQIGLNALEIQGFLNKALCRDLENGEAISLNHFADTLQISKPQIEQAIALGISLPIRPHDFSKVRSSIPLKNFEFHLTYGDLRRLTKDFLKQISPDEIYSVHLPDYINSSNLIDFFSHDPHVKLESFNSLDKTVEFAKYLATATERKVPIIASFSNLLNHSNYLEMVQELVIKHSTDNVYLLPQILPPFAWYFGGSVPLHSFNSLDDFREIRRRDMSICLDISHLIMVSIYEKKPLLSYLEVIDTQIKHFHLSAALGVDGEGASLIELDDDTLNELNYIWTRSEPKVLEVWQGHMNDFLGFRSEVLNCLEWVNRS